MNRTNNIRAILAGSAIAAGLLGGAVAGVAPAQANAAPATRTCVAVKVVATPASVTSLLTRPGQLDAAQAPPRASTPVTSCLNND